jgi:hypothetical protein
MSKLTEKQRLEVYDHLRKAHAEIGNIWRFYGDSIRDSYDEIAIDAVDNVLYLAEGVFAKSEQ